MVLEGDNNEIDMSRFSSGVYISLKINSGRYIRVVKSDNRFFINIKRFLYYIETLF